MLAVPLCLLVFPLRLHIANNSVLTTINRAVACFWDLLAEVCVLDAAPLSWRCNVPPTPSLSGTNLGQLFALCLDVAFLGFGFSFHPHLLR